MEGQRERQDWEKCNGKIGHVALGSVSMAADDAKGRPMKKAPPHWPLRFLFRHPYFISRRIPVQSVAVAGKLVVLAATNDDILPALSQPLIFDPLTANWTLDPQIAAPRRWCAAGASQDGKFSRDAIDAVGWSGKLCMVNVSGGAVKEGIIYIEKDSWEEMPAGMLAGSGGSRIYKRRGQNIYL